MSKLINLSIDNKPISVPEGILIIDAAKQASIDIPVFCYHPKLKPAGMCRMCLVEIGRPVIDRATGQPVLQPDGKPQVQFGPKLETSCTTSVSEGMVVVTSSDKVKAARKDMLEFILTSHPLDCPVCDKGGECPLQNLTLAYGPGQSRFVFDEKMHLAKHVPLGELIYLDRERCIQCGRCVRFQEDIAGDPVIGFYDRGRSFEIVTYSDPGFDSYLSGNTTDICPVGALTTADFRFGARPWELNATASLCPHCPVGCNLTFNVRREAASGGQVVIKRVMPRQNEAVNEIWICDKGRFAYQYTESTERLTTPLIRKEGQLKPASWEEALELVARRFRQAGKDLLVLTSGRLANEDLFTLRHLADGLQGTAALYTQMAGGELTVQYGAAPGKPDLGASPGTDLGQMGKGSAILVVASNLHEEAPIWYLRVKQAAERGATLIVANARSTRLDEYAAYTLRYTYGQEAETIRALTPGSQAQNPARTAAAQAFTNAESAVILFGGDGLGLAGSQALAQSCADLIGATSQRSEASGMASNTFISAPDGAKRTCSLIGVWPRANDQGAWELGLQPLSTALAPAPFKALYVVAADPFGDEALEARLLAMSVQNTVDSMTGSSPFLVVQDLFLTETARRADVVLPAQAFTERDGTFTSGQRRVQRFYPAVPEHLGCRPDYAISADIGTRLGLELESRSPGAVFARISAEIPAFRELTYRKLAETTPQWPAIGSGLDRKGLYFSGTGYDNKQGLGAQLTHVLAPSPLAPLPVGEGKSLQFPPSVGDGKGDDMLAVPITCLYDRGQTVWESKLLRNRGGNRLVKPWVAIHPAEAARLGIVSGQEVELEFSGGLAIKKTAAASIDETVPAGVILAPRSFGLAINTPTIVTIHVSLKA